MIYSVDMGSYTCPMMSFGYCDFSAQPHFENLSRENRYRASWTSHTFQEKSLVSSTSSASKSNPKRMSWSPAASTTAKSAEVATSSKRMTWAAAGSALNKRASWLLPTSASSSSSDRSTSTPPVPNKRILALQTTYNSTNKKGKSRRSSIINGCMERVKSLRKKNRRDHENYWELDDASARMISTSYRIPGSE